MSGRSQYCPRDGDGSRSELISIQSADDLEVETPVRLRRALRYLNLGPEPPRPASTVPSHHSVTLHARYLQT